MRSKEASHEVLAGDSPHAKHLAWHVHSATARWLLVVLLVTSGGCGGAAHTALTARPAATWPGFEGLPPDLRQLNEKAQVERVCEARGGVKFCDPYRSLETDTPATQQWIAAQTQHTAQLMAAVEQPERRQRIAELLSIGNVDDARSGGPHLFFTQREGDRERPALYILRKGASEPELLVDPDAFGERAALDWHYPSPSGRYLAFGISHAGDERSSLHLLDVRSGDRLPYVIEHTKWSHVSWLHDDSGFYYARYPFPGDPHYDPAHEDTYHRSLHFHQLGDDPAEDAEVFAARAPTDFPWASVSEDDRHVIVHNVRSWSASDVYLLDRTAAGEGLDLTPEAEHPLQAIVSGVEHLHAGQVHKGMLYLMTDIDAPNRRIIAVDPEHAADHARWRDVVAESEAPIEDWTVVGDEVLVHTVEDVQSVLRAHPLTSGGRVRTLPLPAEGSLSGLSGDPATGRATFTFSAYFQPPSLLVYEGGSLHTAYRVRSDVDFSRFAFSKARVTSEDGTVVDVQYLHAKGMQPTGEHPVLLYGYGGFNISLLPAFHRHAIYWLERGGVYAMANVRGGGERGEAWHQSGMREHKPRAFEDFEAVIRWFSDSGISQPARIGITGGSNGGLLVGALVTRAPTRFAAAAAYVGLYDMLRYTTFPPAALWVSEYGDPQDPDAAQYLHAYSPYHQVRDGESYPAVLIETADHDTRVHWAHSTKFAAHLQMATVSRSPVLFLMERSVGHGRGTGLSDLVERYVRAYGFFETTLGVPPSPN